MHGLTRQTLCKVFGWGTAIAIAHVPAVMAHTGHPHNRVAPAEKSQPTSTAEPAKPMVTSSEHAMMENPYTAVFRPALAVAEMTHFSSLSTPPKASIAGALASGSGLGEVAFFLVIGSPVFLYAARQRWAEAARFRSME